MGLEQKTVVALIILLNLYFTVLDIITVITSRCYYYNIKMVLLLAFLCSDLV